MSRRASFFNKQNPGKPRVRFADELVFNDNVKEQDIPAMEAMLRRSSLQMDINSINSAGLTPLHQAVLDGNIAVTKLLIAHGADVNKQDEDFWTPLHAACAEGHSDIVRYLLAQGADRQILTDNGERPLDLVEPTDFSTIKAMLEDVAASCSQADNSDEDDDDNDDDDADDDDEGEGNRGRRRNYGDDETDDHDDYDHHNDHGDRDEEDDDDDDEGHHRGGKENMHRNARLLEDEDVMGDLEYVSPDEEDEEEEENRRRRRLRQSERSRSGSKSTSEQEVHYRSEEDRLDMEDSELEQRMPRQKHEQFYGSQGEEEVSDEEHFELQENYYQQNPDLNYDIENENGEFSEPPREFEEDLSDRSGDRECRQRPQRHYIDGGSDDERKGRFYYDIEGEESDELNRHRHPAEHDDHHPCDSGEERYYRETNKDANNNSNNEDSQAIQYNYQQCSSEFRGGSTEKEQLSNISEQSVNEHLHLPKPGEISADEITA
ncbi:sarcoplasmic reticulum histidine-rich calcium-binding protein [Octopus sinensis]|uniref:Sarcoplasmic reticulum histidine-rich calcium-binding protein n=1 Tax=Octopus sinensis TaxID=2607531 RepID=A0A6P7U236_9MOLL|nr:sarcoplasmic reticulum histidine-rich calcium-binding protein [Octopus sinensis]